MFPILYLCQALRSCILDFFRCLSDANMRTLLSGVPAIEQLEISRYHDTDMQNLYVYSCSHKSLTIRNCHFGHGINLHHKVSIDAPKLEFLELSDLVSEEGKIQLPLMIKAKIDVFGLINGINDSENQVLLLLRQMLNVKFLCLTCYIMKILYEEIRESLIDRNSITFHSLTDFKMTAPFTSPGASVVLLDVLECMPNLEVLVVEITYVKLWHPLCPNVCCRALRWFNLNTFQLLMLRLK